VAVYVTQSETSTGVVHDVESIARAVRPTGALVVVDAVSSLGGVELAVDAWGIDVAVAGSQKALMCPPGLAFASVSPRAWEQSDRATLPRHYLSWRVAAESQRKNDTAFTPAVTIVAALHRALELIEARGKDAIWAHNRRLAYGAREGVKALGLDLYGPDDETSAMVTAFLMPDGIDGQKCYSVLRDRHGIVLAGGQGKLRGRIMRIGHMGFMNEFDIVTALAGLELALAELGYRSPVPGAGAARAIEVFAGG
jgi:serine---pyruvate transaminase